MYIMTNHSLARRQFLTVETHIKSNGSILWWTEWLQFSPVSHHSTYTHTKSVCTWVYGSFSQYLVLIPSKDVSV
jgi:hypothetical protein